MRLKGRFRLSFTNVFVTVVLFATLGGTAFAALKVTGKNIKDNTVTSADVKNRTLTKKDLRKGLLESSNASPLSSIAYEASRVAGPSGVAAGEEFTAVASVSVPPGSYAIFAKTDLQAEGVSPPGAASSCQLQAGGKVDISKRGLRSNGTADAQNLQLAATLAGQGTITLSCKTSDGSWAATGTKILAMRVDSEQG